MRVVVKLFAAYREAVGQSEIVCEVADGCTVARLAKQLGEQHPRLGERLGAARFAVNRDYVAPETVLHDGDELVLIPPVAGG